tara:strand:+ start:189 stop:2051 length:1863 start_codon:yes stop_codon:yes gene_type:complete
MALQPKYHEEDVIKQLIKMSVKKNKMTNEKAKEILTSGLIGSLLTTQDYKTNIITREIFELLPSDVISENYLESITFMGGSNSNNNEVKNAYNENKIESLEKTPEEGSSLMQSLTDEEKNARDENNEEGNNQDLNPVLDLFDTRSKYNELRELKDIFARTNQENLFARLSGFIRKGNVLSKYTFLVAFVSFLETISFYYNENVDGFASSTIIFLLSAVLMQFQNDSKERKKIMKKREQLQIEIESKVDEIASTFQLYHGSYLEKPESFSSRSKSAQPRRSNASNFSIPTLERAVTDSILSNKNVQIKISKEEAIRRLLESQELIDNGIEPSTVVVVPENYVENNNVLYQKIKDVVDAYNELREKYNAAIDQYEEPNSILDDFINEYPELTTNLSEKIGDLFTFIGRATISMSKIVGKSTLFLSKASIYISIQIVRAIHIGLRETGMYPYVIGGTFIWITRQQILYPVIQNAVFHFLKTNVANRIIDGVQSKLAQAATEVLREISVEAAQTAATAAAQAATEAATEAATGVVQPLLIEAATGAATAVATQLIEDQVKSKASGALVNALTNFVTNPQVFQTLTDGATGLLQLTSGGRGNRTRKIKRNKNMNRRLCKRTRRNR